MTIIKNAANLNQNFFIASNETINDSRLSHKAIGIWLRLASKKEDWEISIEGLIKLYPLDGEKSVRSGLKELAKFGYLVREAAAKNRGRFTKSPMFLSHRPMFENPLSDEQVEFLFSFEMSKGLVKEEDFKKMFPNDLLQSAKSSPQKEGQLSTKELSTEYSLSNARAKDSEIKVHMMGALPKKKIEEAEDGAPEINLTAHQIDAISKKAVDSGIPIDEAKALANEVILAYRYECGANQAMHEKPYWAIQKWMMHAINRWKEQKQKGKTFKPKCQDEIKSNIDFSHRTDSVPFSTEILDSIFK